MDPRNVVYVAIVRIVRCNPNGDLHNPVVKNTCIPLKRGSVGVAFRYLIKIRDLKFIEFMRT